MANPAVPAHKYHQHDAELTGDVDDPEMLDLEEALAIAMTPEHYLLSESDAWGSAVEQAVILRRESGDG